jgi:hypothetical protein
MSGGGFFENAFRPLTGHSPMGWQRRMFRECFARGEMPSALAANVCSRKTWIIWRKCDDCVDA